MSRVSDAHVKIPTGPKVISDMYVTRLNKMNVANDNGTVTQPFCVQPPDKDLSQIEILTSRGFFLLERCLLLTHSQIPNPTHRKQSFAGHKIPDSLGRPQEAIFMTPLSSPSQNKSVALESRP